MLINSRSVTHISTKILHVVCRIDAKAKKAILIYKKKTYIKMEKH